MTFSRHSSRIYCDEYDVDGALNVLSRRITNDPSGEATPYYVGAHLILNLMRNHEDLRDQSVVMALFDRALEDNGIKAYEGE